MMAPNIIFILIDDMGWRDLACYGSPFYETPNIDRLAAKGMRFTQAYAACPVCSPTRASILTGKYPAELGITNWIDWSGQSHPNRGRLIDVPYVNHLPLSEHSIAAALSEGGYAAWHVGKWHLGGLQHYPERHGFQVNIGGWEAGMPVNGYFSPWEIPTLKDGPVGECLTDRLTDEAIRLIEEHVRRADSPFFLNLWYYAVHTPIQAKPELIAKYEQKAKSMGLDMVEAIVEGEHFPAEHKMHLRIQRRVIQSDPVYAAMIETVDANIGRLLDTLEHLGIADDTLVVFTSDNGGLATSEGSPTCNAPLAEGKGWMYEGGTREPLLVCWPAVIESGTVCDTVVTSPDFYPTLLEAAGLALKPEQHRDGVSFLPILKGQVHRNRGPIFWHYPHYGNQGGTPGSSVRKDDWKLIEFFEDGRLELYDLHNDVGETRNLVAEETDRAKELHGILVGWRESVEAKIPQPNPHYSKTEASAPKP